MASDAITGVGQLRPAPGTSRAYRAERPGKLGQPHHHADPQRIDLTVGGNFADDKGNAVISLNYLDRGAISRRMRATGPYRTLAVGRLRHRGLVQQECKAGTSLSPLSAGQTCETQAGGRQGLDRGRQRRHPQRPLHRRSAGSGPVPASNPALDAAPTAAGLGGMGSRGFTFNDTGTTARPALTPQDDFNLGPTTTSSSRRSAGC
ncbi:hypothetical protein ACRAWD_00760 [Caulobacter segnis]